MSVNATAPAGNTSTGTTSGSTTNRKWKGKGGHNNNRNPRILNTFKGTVKEMNGHVFQCYGEATEKNQFARTMEELNSYVGLNFKNNPNDIKKMMKLTKNITFEMPTDHDDLATKATIFIWQQDCITVSKSKKAYEDNKCALYSVIWNQCSEAMQAKVKSDDGYDEMYESSDSLELIKIIKGVAYKFESQKNIYLALDDAKCTFYAYHQGADESNSSYMSKFKNFIEVIEHYGGSIGEDQALINEELKSFSTPNDKETKTAKETAKQKMHAIAFLKRADKNRYSLLVTDLENNFTRGTDQYPTSITETYNLLVNYKKPENKERHSRAPRANGGDRNTSVQQDELAFVQQVQPNVPLEDVQCYNCQQMGHYATTCTSARVTRHQAAIQLLQHCTIEEATFEDEESDFDDDEDIHFSFNLTDAITLTQAHMIDPNWILLDSESTVSIFSNGKYLKNIRHCGTAKGLRIYSNGGSQDTHMIGDLPGFGTVWYNKGSLANILSLAAVRKICRVTMDTMTEAAIIVHKHNGDKMKFTESANGLYYYDVKSSSTKSSNYSFVNSVNENKSLYTRRQLKDADLAKRVYELVGRPAHATFIKMISENQLQNCPITVDDA